MSTAPSISVSEHTNRERRLKGLARIIVDASGAGVGLWNALLLGEEGRGLTIALELGRRESLKVEALTPRRICFHFGSAASWPSRQSHMRSAPSKSKPSSGRRKEDSSMGLSYGSVFSNNSSYSSNYTSGRYVHFGHQCITDDNVLDPDIATLLEGTTSKCGYYFINHEKQSIFWAHDFDMTLKEKFYSTSHPKYALEGGYWWVPVGHDSGTTNLTKLKLGDIVICSRMTVLFHIMFLTNSGTLSILHGQIVLELSMRIASI
ncbi:hypothetical protein DFH29DRAFT_871776 [Suillus ampliporus]|nr:hypothetical protein DFH29DRAFT_871776 [Suillus ampliporus]